MSVRMSRRTLPARAVVGAGSLQAHTVCCVLCRFARACRYVRLPDRAPAERRAPRAARVAPRSDAPLLLLSSVSKWRLPPPASRASKEGCVPLLLARLWAEGTVGLPLVCLLAAGVVCSALSSESLPK